MARAPKKRSARARPRAGKRARRPSAKRWNERLTPQQKAAVTRAKNALAKARRGSAKEEKAREQLAATLERAGASRRSASASAAAVVREKSKKKTRTRAKPPPAPKRRPTPKKPAPTRRRPPKPAVKPPTKPRRPRKLSGRAWEAQLTEQQRRTIERARRALESAPPQTTPARRAEWQRRRERYARALARSNASDASIRARLAAAERRRITVRNIRDGLLGRSLDAGAYRQDWRILNSIHSNRDPRFFAFIDAMEELGFDEDTAVDFWYSPEALD